MKTITFLIILFISINSFAQWTSDTAVNTLVADSSSEDMQAVSTSDGQTYIIFWKASNLELRLQVLDASGNKTLGDDGVLITDTIPMSTYTVAWSVIVDNDDNLYVGVTATDDSSGYVFKLDIDGNHLWGSDGISLGSAYIPTILPLKSGGAIISWIPGNQAVIQKYDANGDSVWDSPQSVINGSSKTAPANLFELFNGDCILVFHTYNYGVSSTLYAQKYNTDGEAQWTTPTQLSDRTTAYNKFYGGLQDGDTIYYGYCASTSTRFDSFVQKINPDGTIPWGINGMDFDINETDYELDTKVAYTTGSQYIWTICTYSNPAQTEYGEYIQKFDKDTGERQFTDNAKEVYAISSDFKQHASSLFVHNEKPFFLVSIGPSDGVSTTTLDAVLLDTNGDFQWTEESKPVATYNAFKHRIQFTKPIDGQAVAVFIEDKTTGKKIYAQNFTDTELLSIDDREFSFGSSITAFPNPIKNNLTISSTIATRFSIYNSIGDKVMNGILVSGDNTIDCSSLNTGIYYIKTKSGIVKKILKY